MDFPFPQQPPFYAMAKPAGARCNLACTYCYYTEKSCLHAAGGGAQIMSDDVLETYVRQYIEASRSASGVLFTWHGGEPLLRPISFYRRVLELQRKYADGMPVDNSLQTNGTLLDARWADFLAENHFLVGLSIDGPREMHDYYRLSRQGHPTWHAVQRAARLLTRSGVEWNAMSVVTDRTASDPDAWYDFFRSQECRFVQFTPVVERLFRHADGRVLATPLQDDAVATLAPYSVSPEAWGDFLIRVFDRWVRADVGSLFVQIFDSTLARWAGLQPSLCSMAETCGHAVVVEADGDVYACDHFVFPSHRLGNIRQTPLGTLAADPRLRQFGQWKREGLTRECRECPWLFACGGECPRLRFATSSDGEACHNYLCAGYRRFFSHVAPYMDYMKNEVLHDRPASSVMGKTFGEA